MALRKSPTYVIQMPRSTNALESVNRVVGTEPTIVLRRQHSFLQQWEFCLTLGTDFLDGTAILMTILDDLVDIESAL